MAGNFSNNNPGMCSEGFDLFRGVHVWTIWLIQECAVKDLAYPEVCACGGSGLSRTGLTHFTRDYIGKVATERAHLRLFTGSLVHTPS